MRTNNENTCAEYDHAALHALGDDVARLLVLWSLNQHNAAMRFDYPAPYAWCMSDLEHHARRGVPASVAARLTGLRPAFVFAFNAASVEFAA